jgi:hypothetical protein
MLDAGSAGGGWGGEGRARSDADGPRWQPPLAARYTARMKPHPRIRKTAKWGGAIATVLLVVWIGSGWGAVSCWAPYSGLSSRVGDGGFEVSWGDGLQLPPDQPVGGAFGEGWQIGTTYTVCERFPRGDFPTAWWWWGDLSSNAPAVCVVAVPLWVPASLALAITALAWRLDALARRRAMINLCATCRYDRTGLAAGVACPECGSPPAPSAPPRPPNPA